MSGLFLVNVGHGRAEIADAVAAQLRTLAFANPSEHPSGPAVRLAGRLAGLAPGDLDQVVFVNSGSEANEVALKLARQYHFLRGERGRYKFIARAGSYHGGTFGAMSVSGSRMLHQEQYEPLLPRTCFVPQPDCYRCPLGLEYPDCGIQCARMVQQVIEVEGADTVAAFIGEPISNSAGVVVPPPEYWPTVREICDRYGVLLIHDEVITGFGRTGLWFGSEHWGVVPDIMTLAKGMTSGYQPLGAAVVSRRVAEVFSGDDGAALGHVSTFGGHPGAAAAALANLDIMERESLVARSAAMGAELMDRLRELLVHPIVGDVRGLGLMCGIELVRDKTTKERFGPADNVPERMVAKLRERGLLCRVGAVINITPPLILGHAELERIVEALDSAIEAFEHEVGRGT
jgi:adenosylmethionine-8-amino-7-oxononanoate aminotransferase